MQSEDQARLLDEASAVVREQAFYMKRAIDSDNLRDSLKHASNLICELRTSLLSPKNYYDLYMQVFQELHHLHDFFSDPTRHAKKMADLYESVQQAANILPRLYLLVTVGAAYIKSKEAPAAEILKDVSELCKGVQHPTRGLFLRSYLGQMMKNKLPDVGSEYESPDSSIHDAFDFILSNFLESMRLWCRIQPPKGHKDSGRREKERQDLSALVGANLVRLSQLDGLTWEFYRDHALPKLLEQLVATKDAMAQQYLLDCIIQVFPDEFHLASLEKLLAVLTKVQAGVDLKQTVVRLMNRLSKFVQSSPEVVPPEINIFELFKSHLAQIVSNNMEIGSLLELQVAFLNFTQSLFPDRLDYVDTIMGGTVTCLLRYLGYEDEHAQPQKLQGEGVDSVVEILCTPLKSLGLKVLYLEHYPNLVQLLNFNSRRQVAKNVANTIIEKNVILDNEGDLQRFMTYLAPILADDPDRNQRAQMAAMMNQNQPQLSEVELSEIMAEQEIVCRVIHRVQNDDYDTQMKLWVTVRKFLGHGGPRRVSVTLPVLIHKVLDQLPMVRSRELNVDGGPPPEFGAKKYLQFIHSTVSASLNNSVPEVAVQIWLKGACVANLVDSASPGQFDQICTEFLEQALGVFEEEVTDFRQQFRCINLMVGALQNMSCIEESSYDKIAASLTQIGARLQKKTQQCRAVSICSHLFYNRTRQSEGKVAECLQKCLKVAEQCVQQSPAMVILFMETLDSYIYYYENQCPDITIANVTLLVEICLEHCKELKRSNIDPQTIQDCLEYMRQILNHLQWKKQTDARWVNMDDTVLSSQV